MKLFRSIRVYRSLIVVALGTLVITGCRQGTTTPGTDSSSSIEVSPVLGASAVVGDDLPDPTYYLYILDRDGVPVQRFECDGSNADNYHDGRYCDHLGGTHTVVSEAVPALLTTEELPLKGAQPAPEQ